MLYTILIVVAVVIVLLLLFIAMQPGEYTVSRTGRMTAPSAKVFEQVNDFRKWTAWSPWEKVDPNLKRTYGGPPQGVGATYQWAGDKNVGEGGMTIVESRPNDLIRLKLEFLKPFAAVCDTVFTFQSEGNQTVMIWTMTGKKNYFAKFLHLMISMDKMIGGQFEKGLATLKSVVEGKAA